MSSLRKMKRKKAIQLAKSGDMKEALKQHEESVKDRVRAEATRFYDGEKKRIGIEAQGQLMILTMAYLNLQKHHTGKWLRQFLRDLLQFQAQMATDGMTTEDFIKLLKEEAGLDIDREIKECRHMLEDDAMERRAVASRIRKEGIA